MLLVITFVLSSSWVNLWWINIISKSIVVLIIFVPLCVARVKVGIIFIAAGVFFITPNLTEWFFQNVVLPFTPNLPGTFRGTGACLTSFCMCFLLLYPLAQLLCKVDKSLIDCNAELAQCTFEDLPILQKRKKLQKHKTATKNIRWLDYMREMREKNDAWW